MRLWSILFSFELYQRNLLIVSVFSFFILKTFLDRKEVTDRVIAVLKNFEKVDASKVTPVAHFNNDLGLDSLDAVEVCMALEEEFVITIPDAEAEKILSIEDAVNFISTHPQAK
jgi:NADH dehydrogenase (ubiquinone) 1 alpha/beta subcomplex 1